jgi:hypothetical protein
MNRSLHNTAVQALRWVLGLFLVWKSFLLFRDIASKIQMTGHVGLHAGILLTISGLEVVAAAMFVIPVVKTAGGYLLLAVLALAAVFHIMHGEFNTIATLAIYGAAVVVCVTNRPASDGARP